MALQTHRKWSWGLGTIKRTTSGFKSIIDHMTLPKKSTGTKEAKMIYNSLKEIHYCACFQLWSLVGVVLICR